jgi:hypothetical protein
VLGQGKFGLNLEVKVVSRIWSGGQLPCVDLLFFAEFSRLGPKSDVSRSFFAIFILCFSFL